MSYPMTFADMKADVMSRLSEVAPANSVIAQLPSGTGGAATISNDTTVGKYINESAQEGCRLFYPVYDTGTYTLPIGTASFPLTSLTVTSENVLWAARAVVWNGVPLTHWGRSDLELWMPTWAAIANADPANWFEQGLDGIGIVPAPSTQHSILVNGLALFKSLSDDNDVFPCQPDLNELWVIRTCQKIAERVPQRTDYESRLQIWGGEWQSRTGRALDRLWRTDPDLAQAHYPAPPQ